ncbi:YdcF family protein [Rhodococcus phenolicus]|uniref:YdcF family protein n=1 Tax=Rhodococcus phenolicus TaxID=263849 RepID=UPI0008345410|nr:YdcF family protein [Rhodococcus phenolicus]
MRVRVPMLVGSVVAAAALSLGGGPAQAVDPVTIANGILATAGGCRTDVLPLIRACTAQEALTASPPVQLELLPQSTAIVVLGAGLLPDGTIRPVLDERLRSGLDLANRFPQAPIIVSGGAPKSGVTEAAAMARWLVDRGIPRERITLEDRSGSTVENAVNTDHILRDRGLLGATVVTSRNHLARALVDFRTAVDGRIPVTGVVAD